MLRIRSPNRNELAGLRYDWREQRLYARLFPPMITIEPPSSPLALEAVSTLSRSGLSRFVNRACAAVALDGSVEVLLTSDGEMRRLNRTFRGKNKTTDVLSFPAAQEAEGIAGDLAISLDTAARQAEEQGHTLRDELRILLLHGLLHLAGEDHENDAGEMAARESELRAQLKLRSGLIERTHGSKRKTGKDL